MSSNMVSTTLNLSSREGAISFTSASVSIEAGESAVKYSASKKILLFIPPLTAVSKERLLKEHVITAREVDSWSVHAMRGRICYLILEENKNLLCFSPELLLKIAQEANSATASVLPQATQDTSSALLNLQACTVGFEFAFEHLKKSNTIVHIAANCQIRTLLPAEVKALDDMYDRTADKAKKKCEAFKSSAKKVNASYSSAQELSASKAKMLDSADSGCLSCFGCFR